MLAPWRHSLIAVVDDFNFWRRRESAICSCPGRCSRRTRQHRARLRPTVAARRGIVNFARARSVGPSRPRFDDSNRIHLASVDEARSGTKLNCNQRSIRRSPARALMRSGELSPPTSCGPVCPWMPPTTINSQLAAVKKPFHDTLVHSSSPYCYDLVFKLSE